MASNARSNRSPAAITPSFGGRMYSGPVEVIDGDDLPPAIVGVIESAAEWLIVASPYLDLEGWENALRAVKEATMRVPVSFITKKHVKHGDREHQANVAILRRLGCDLYFVQRDHAKLYCNESRWLEATKNLAGTSVWSYDRGLMLETREWLREGVMAMATAMNSTEGSWSVEGTHVIEVIEETIDGYWTWKEGFSGANGCILVNKRDMQRNGFPSLSTGKTYAMEGTIKLSNTMPDLQVLNYITSIEELEPGRR